MALKQQKLTPAQNADFQFQLILSFDTMRKGRTMLNKFGLNIFSGEHAVRAEAKKRIEFLSKADMQIEEVYMLTGKEGKPVEKVDLLISNDVEAYIREVFSHILSTGNDFFSLDPVDDLDQPAKNVCRIVLSGDKGGESMKFHFKIVHPGTNVYDCHVIAMYNGSDKMIALKSVARKFEQALRKMCSPGYTLLGYKVSFFTGGGLQIP